MVRRSVEIHLLRHVAGRKLENRDTCVYIRRDSRVRRNWFVRDYPLKKKMSTIDLRPSARAIAFGERRFAGSTDAICSRADNGKRIFDVSPVRSTRYSEIPDV